MNTPQKTILGAAFAAAVGLGIFEARQNSQLRSQLQMLQQQQSSLTESVGQLKQEHEDTQHQLVEMRDSPPKVHTNAVTAAPRKIDTNTISSEMLISELERALSETAWGKREAAFQRLKRFIAQEDIPRALAFLAEQPDMKGMKTPLFEDLTSRWGSKDPNAAAQWAMSLSDTNVQERALVDVLRGWSETSRQAAANYAAQLPAGNLQTDALKDILNGWSFNDPQAAAQWIIENPQFADDGVGPIFFWGNGRCPGELADLLDTIGSTSLYQQHGEEVGMAWLREDKYAARTWIEQAPLPDDIKQRLLAQAQRDFAAW